MIVDIDVERMTRNWNCFNRPISSAGNVDVNDRRVPEIITRNVPAEQSKELSEHLNIYNGIK